MPKRVCWKKGMRLTDEVLRLSDDCHALQLGHAFVLAAAGRFGLLPSVRQFELSVNISKGIADVEAINCQAITRGGDLIDAQYDTRYTNTFDTRVQIPDLADCTEYILVIATERRWQEMGDGLEAPVYSFRFQTLDTPIPDNALPIGHIVDDYGWRMDDLDFVPPCLYVSAHRKYVEIADRFREILGQIDARAHGLANGSGRDAVRIFWPLTQAIRITMDKERDTLTPMTLLGNVQKCVSAFTCACELDENLELADAEAFTAYVNAPYDYKDTYQRIKEGLEICFAISEKVEKLQAAPRVEKLRNATAPVISEDQLMQNCRSKSISLKVTNYSPDAMVLYSVDGGEPSKRLPRTSTIMLENGFNKMKVPESDRQVTVRLKAVANGVESNTNTFTVTLHKDYRSWEGYEI